MGDEKNDIQTVLNLWHECVELANITSSRRDTMNNFYMTLNVAITAAVSLIGDTKSMLLAAIGIVVCIAWLLMINNYRNLNTEKYKVILSLEKELPFQPLTDEWKGLKKRLSQTKIDRMLPIAFIVAYCIVLIVNIKG